MYQRILRSAVVLIPLLVLSGCTGVPLATAQPSSSPVASPEASPSPSTTPSPAPAAIPDDCAALVEPGRYAATFGDTPLNDPGFVGQEGDEYYTPTGAIEPVPSESGATPRQVLFDQTQLRCIWRDPRADITGISVELATVDPAIAAEYLATLPAEGYECAETDGGQRCQRVEPDVQYPVDVADTAFLRDSVFIRIWQANFPTDNLLGAIVSTVWR